MWSPVGKPPRWRAMRRIADGQYRLPVCSSLSVFTAPEHRLGHGHICWAFLMHTSGLLIGARNSTTAEVSDDPDALNPANE
jgi:hypothetical protein